MNLDWEKVEQYAMKMTSPEADILKKLSRETHAKVLRPRMLSGHLQGKFLEFIARLTSPRTILEIGTYTGYSAICLAQGLTEHGLLHTIDHNAELEDFAKRFFKEAGLSEKIVFHVGEALEVIPTLQENWDLVFIDADKENYISYFELVLPRLRKGGLIIADNVLWSGKVLEETPDTDKETQGIIAFNEYVSSHPGVTSLLLPLRDGLMILQKI
jgi:caffeoyl-CoA O-methyltransferase